MAKLRLLNVLILFVVLNLSSKAQTLTYFNCPARQELEIDLSLGNSYKIGCIYNKYKSYFINKKEYCTYIYTQVPISIFNFKIAIGHGTYSDVELSIGYKDSRFEIDIGSSIKEPLILELKFNLFKNE